MNRQRQRDDAVLVERYADGEQTVLVADFGPGGNALDVDVVDDTLLVVDGSRTREFDLPAGDAHTFNNNGVVTVEVCP